MTMSHGPTARTDISSDVVLSLIGAGAGVGKLILRTAAGTEVATLTFSNPAGVVVGAVLTFGAITSDGSATGGIVSKATIEDDSGNVVLNANSVTLIGGGGDIELSALDIPAGAIVGLSFLSYTAPV